MQGDRPGTLFAARPLKRMLGGPRTLIVPIIQDSELIRIEAAPQRLQKPIQRLPARKWEEEAIEGRSCRRPALQDLSASMDIQAARLLEV